MQVRLEFVVLAFVVVGVLSSVTGAGIGMLIAPRLPRAGSHPASQGEFDERADGQRAESAGPTGLSASELLAAEREAEEFAERRWSRFVASSSPDEGTIPLPPAPVEGGLLGELTDSRLRGEDRDAFYLAAAANQRTEAGTQGARFSSLRTTAGPEHRASYGAAQLTIRDHLGHLSRLTDAQLVQLDIPRRDLAAMQRGGEAVTAWYDLLVLRREASAHGARIGLSLAQAQEAQRLALERDPAALVRRFGARFAEHTGLPRDALAALASTATLRRTELREQFRRRYARQHGVDFDPARRESSRMIPIARSMAAERADLGRVLTALGDGDAGAAALAHYLGVGDVAENYYGWYARGARNAIGSSRYVALLAHADPISTRSRELSNFESAVAAVRGVQDLHGVERARMLTRIGRCFHGAPARARAAFFHDDTTSRPRATTAAELEAGIQEYRLGRRWSDDRVQQAFDELVAAGGTNR